MRWRCLAGRRVSEEVPGKDGKVISAPNKDDVTFQAKALVIDNVGGDRCCDEVTIWRKSLHLDLVVGLRVKEDFLHKVIPRVFTILTFLRPNTFESH